MNDPYEIISSNTTHILLKRKFSYQLIHNTSSTFTLKRIRVYKAPTQDLNLDLEQERKRKLDKQLHLEQERKKKLEKQLEQERKYRNNTQNFYVEHTDEKTGQVTVTCIPYSKVNSILTLMENRIIHTIPIHYHPYATRSKIFVQTHITDVISYILSFFSAKVPDSETITQDTKESKDIIPKQYTLKADCYTNTFLIFLRLSKSWYDMTRYGVHFESWDEQAPVVKTISKGWMNRMFTCIETPRILTLSFPSTFCQHWFTHNILNSMPPILQQCYETYSNKTKLHSYIYLLIGYMICLIDDVVPNYNLDVTIPHSIIVGPFQTTSFNELPLLVQSQRLDEIKSINELCISLQKSHSIQNIIDYTDNIQSSYLLFFNSYLNTLPNEDVKLQFTLIRYIIEQIFKIMQNRTLTNYAHLKSLCIEDINLFQLEDFMYILSNPKIEKIEYIFTGIDNIIDMNIQNPEHNIFINEFYTNCIICCFITKSLKEIHFQFRSKSDTMYQNTSSYLLENVFRVLHQLPLLQKIRFDTDFPVQNFMYHLANCEALQVIEFGHTENNTSRKQEFIMTWPTQPLQSIILNFGHKTHFDIRPPPPYRCPMTIVFNQAPVGLSFLSSFTNVEFTTYMINVEILEIICNKGELSATYIADLVQGLPNLRQLTCCLTDEKWILMERSCNNMLYDPNIYNQDNRRKCEIIFSNKDKRPLETLMNGMRFCPNNIFCTEHRDIIMMDDDNDITTT